MEISYIDQCIVNVIQDGLPLVHRPYAEIGKRIGLSEQTVIDRIHTMLQNGLIKRFGVVVRHHELGYIANAMVVWDIPDDEVSSVGQKIASSGMVTLCYRRPRRLPDWPYNLFCMLHGRDRKIVMQNIRQLTYCCGLGKFSYEVLFSQRRFKQCGAKYILANEGSIGENFNLENNNKQYGFA